MSRKLKAMLVRMAQEHKAADKKCGRKWECSCGACNSVRQFGATKMRETASPQQLLDNAAVAPFKAYLLNNY